MGEQIGPHGDTSSEVEKKNRYYKLMIATTIPTVLIVAGVTLAAWGFVQDVPGRISLGIIISVLGGVVALFEIWLTLRFIKKEDIIKEEEDVLTKPVF